MWKKYCKVSFLVLLTVLVVPCFFSCNDDNEEVVGNQNPPQPPMQYIFILGSLRICILSMAP